MNNKLVIYTALFGQYDNLIEPKEKFEGCDFICFTDQKDLITNIWGIRFIEGDNLTPQMMNRKYKILPHLFLSEYTWSLYVDANIYIKENPIVLAKKYLNDFDMVMPKHFIRDCIYDEAQACVMLGKTHYVETKQQMDKYKNENFPQHFGLGENNILFRKHNQKKIVKLMNYWWEEFNLHTKRDQLSLAYVLWKNGEKFCFMNESARGGNFFSLMMHKHDMQKGFWGNLLNIKNKYIINFPNGWIKKYFIDKIPQSNRKK